jgi:acyl-CoA reductase-like NAD-dependent aldehyde dehydrogenase
VAAPRPFLLAGRWRHTANTAPVVNPYTGETVADVCQAGRPEADEAIGAAVQAFSRMRGLPAHARAGALATIAASLSSRSEEVARTITAEAGKPIADARREVARAIRTFGIAAEEAKRIPGEVVPLDLSPGTDSYLGITRRFPIGPVLGITPFNFPLNLVAHKVAPSLAAGNPIVLKPAPQTPLTAMLLGEMVLEAGLPAGAFSILPCDNPLAQQMVEDPRFTLVSFTGSAAVGWMLKAKAGKKKVILELGGNAGVIVEPDADLELAAQRCAVGGYSYSGQTCISVQRIYVHDAVHDRFLELLRGRVRALKAGDPLDDQTVIGPLITEAAARRVEDWVREAVGAGAKVVEGGQRSGTMMAATVVTEVRKEMKVSCQELFGPAVGVSRYSRFEEALALMNDSPFGLQAGIFTQDVDRIFRAYRALEVGTVLANEIPTFRADHMPYGGIKDSGLGREGVRYAIEEMTEPKLLVLNLRNQDTP